MSITMRTFRFIASLFLLGVLSLLLSDASHALGTFNPTITNVVMRQYGRDLGAASTPFTITLLAYADCGPVFQETDGATIPGPNFYIGGGVIGCTDPAIPASFNDFVDLQTNTLYEVVALKNIAVLIIPGAGPVNVQQLLQQMPSLASLVFLVQVTVNPTAGLTAQVNPITGVGEFAGTELMLNQSFTLGFGNVRVADLDANGQLETVFVNGGVLYVVEPNGTARAGFPLSLFGGFTGPFAIGNVDTAPDLEIVAFTGSASALSSLTVRVIKPNGVTQASIANYSLSSSWVLLNTNPVQQVPPHVQIRDMNNDGIGDVIVSGSYSPLFSFPFLPQSFVNVLSGNLAPFANFPIAIATPIKRIAIGDVDTADATPEIVVLTTPVTSTVLTVGMYHAVSSVPPSYPFVAVTQPYLTIPTGMFASVPVTPLCLVNMDTDAALEIALGDGPVQAHNANGTAVSGWPSASSYGLLAVGDVNGNGFDDAVVKTATGYGVLSNAGVLLPGFFSTSTVAPFNDTVRSVDVDINGLNDLLFLAPSVSPLVGVSLYAISSNGASIPGFPRNIAPAISTVAAPFSGSLALGDLDGDGLVELVVAYGTSLSVYKIARYGGAAPFLTASFTHLGVNANATSSLH